MAHYPLTTEHRCRPDAQAVCWHLRGRLPSGERLAFYAISDSSNGPAISVRMEHPDLAVESVVFGRFDEEHAAQRA